MTGGVQVVPGHVAGMSGLMAGVAGRYDAAAAYSTEKAMPSGNGWTGLLEQLKGPLAGAASDFADRQKIRAQDARTTQEKLASTATLYAGTDQTNADSLSIDGNGSSSDSSQDNSEGNSSSDTGSDIDPENYPSVDDLDFHDPQVEDSQQQEGLKEVVDSGRQQLGENWQGGAHDAIEQTIQGLVQYLQDGLNQQGSYKGRTVTVAQLAVNAQHLTGVTPAAFDIQEAGGPRKMDPPDPSVPNTDPRSGGTVPNPDAPGQPTSDTRTVPGHATPEPGQYFEDGLGEPEGDTKLQNQQIPPSWSPHDKGAGPYDSQWADAHDYQTLAKIEGGLFLKEDE